MNLDNFIEDYYQHLKTGCQVTFCHYPGCVSCPIKNDEMEKLR